MPGDDNSIMDPALEDLGEKSLQTILHTLLNTIETSKSQIFDVYDAAHREVDASQRNLEELIRQTKEVIDEVDALEKQEQQEKQRLVRVSSSFADYSEERIQQAYESVKNVQVDLGIARERERQLRQQRNQLEVRLRHLQKTVIAAQRLAMRIGSMLNFLGSQLSDVVSQLEAASKNKFLSAAIIRAQEEERLRVSRELHDGPAQDVANLMMETSIIERLVDMDPDDARMNLQDHRRHLKDCLHSIRQIIFDMRPMSLDDLGLVAAVEQLVRQMHDRMMLEVKLSIDGNEIPVAPHVKIGLFRIIQEGLNNIIRHAGTKKAGLRLLFTEAAISILIEDNGRGFDLTSEPKSDPDAQDDGHFGLLGMKERAVIIGAQLNVTSVPGQGTKVHLRLPLQPSAAPTLADKKQEMAERRAHAAEAGQ
ncbi:MAG: sensor histidine kinase [Schwartzia sp.]|nr:sensor histidine kinase [Schwartzia sp. (in: firmicutes)]